MHGYISVKVFMTVLPMLPWSGRLLLQWWYSAEYYSHMLNKWSPQPGWTSCGKWRSVCVVMTIVTMVIFSGVHSQTGLPVESGGQYVLSRRSFLSVFIWFVFVVLVKQRVTEADHFVCLLSIALCFCLPHMHSAEHYFCDILAIWWLSSIFQILTCYWTLTPWAARSQLQHRYHIPKGIFLPFEEHPDMVIACSDSHI